MTASETAKHAQTFRRALQDGDVNVLWGIWCEVSPHLPGPKSLREAEIVMHAARTQAECVSLSGRAYSHRWLTERGYPSMLPDHLKARAERLYPRVVEAVGVSVNMPKLFREVAVGVERAMSEAVEELAADGVDLKNREIVHGLMFERRRRTLKQFGLGEKCPS